MKERYEELVWQNKMVKSVQVNLENDHGSYVLTTLSIW